MISQQSAHERRYKWTALTNTTLGVFMALLDSSIVIISLPAIFRGIHLNPLQPSNIGYLLWMLMGYLVVTAVLVVTFGRLGDIFGRVKMYNAGFLVFTIGSAFLAITPMIGAPGALWLIGFRVVQGIGGALLMANSAAILTDAFPPDQRGMALGVNMIAGIAGSFIGLIAGGVLANVNWRLIFWVNVPFGVFGTIWAYKGLHELAKRSIAKIDWLGNVTFAGGLIAILVAITYGIQPYGGHTMGWTSPAVLTELLGGIALLIAFFMIEKRVEFPMFDFKLFKIRAFRSGNFAGLLASVSRGGLQFMLIIWLQGIWLPLHGYSFESTPLWAGIYLLPMTVGFLISGPTAGWLSDKFGARLFATGGMLLSALAFALLMTLPANFPFLVFALLILIMGIAAGMFSAPNTAAVMNSVPAKQRGEASGMRATFQNSGMVLSIGIFFSLLILGLASSLPHALSTNLVAQGVPGAVANKIAHLPPVGTLFAAFLGFNPMATLLGPQVLHALPAARAATLTGSHFFPQLISGAFIHGLRIAFGVAFLMSLVAAGFSWMRDDRYVHDETAVVESPDDIQPAEWSQV